MGGGGGARHSISCDTSGASKASAPSKVLSCSQSSRFALLRRKKRTHLRSNAPPPLFLKIYLKNFRWYDCVNDQHLHGRRCSCRSCDPPSSPVALCFLSLLGTSSSAAAGPQTTRGGGGGSKRLFQRAEQHGKRACV